MPSKRNGNLQLLATMRPPQAQRTQRYIFFRFPGDGGKRKSSALSGEDDYFFPERDCFCSSSPPNGKKEKPPCAFCILYGEVIPLKIRNRNYGLEHLALAEIVF